jgi:hypothetical protein
MTPLETLIRRINRNGDINDLGTPRPLLTLEEFFEGNSDYGSIGYNFCPDQPSPSEFYTLFRSIRKQPDVAEVLVEVSQHEIASEWPSTDTVWIITTVSPDQVRAMLGERFQPDEIFEGWTEHVHREYYPIPEGMMPLGVWWD